MLLVAAASCSVPRLAASAPPLCVPTWSEGFHGGCGDDCCASYCNGSCIFPGPVPALAGRRANVTVTRITPYEVNTPENKDFGDLSGDLDFALMQKSMTVDCVSWRRQRCSPQHASALASS